MSAFEIDDTKIRVEEVGVERTPILHIADFFKDPDAVVRAASEKSYQRINPHYPGLRAPVESTPLKRLCETVGKHAPAQAAENVTSWNGAAWYSIVTCPPAQLAPIQRLPHFDGFDETQVAVMIYLNQTAHGGTAFFRHRSTGFERVTEARYPEYKRSLESDVARSGLPPAEYISSGDPHFEKIGESDAAYNSLIIYPGTLLHSGVIRNDLALDSNPGRGRLTINGFFRPE